MWAKNRFVYRSFFVPLWAGSFFNFFFRILTSRKSCLPLPTYVNSLDSKIQIYFCIELIFFKTFFWKKFNSMSNLKFLRNDNKFLWFKLKKFHVRNTEIFPKCVYFTQLKENHAFAHIQRITNSSKISLWISNFILMFSGNNYTYKKQ